MRVSDFLGFEQGGSALEQCEGFHVTSLERRTSLQEIYGKGHVEGKHKVQEQSGSCHRGGHHQFVPRQMTSKPALP